MTNEDRQQLATLIETWRVRAREWRKWDDDFESDDSAFADGLETCVNELEALLLALLLAEAPRQDQDTKEVTRVEAMGDSTDNPTASENEMTPATVTPNQGRHQPKDDDDAIAALLGLDGHPDRAEQLLAEIAERQDVSDTPAPVTREAGDVPETTTDNPQSWIAWKRRALAAEAKLDADFASHSDRAVDAMATEASAALLETRGVLQEENQEKDARMARLSTSSDASRTAATDVAEGDRSITPNQVSNEAGAEWAGYPLTWGDES